MARDSVNRHREKMRTEGFARMEVTLGAGLIMQAREFAKKNDRPLWDVVEDALLAYLKSENAAVTGNAK